MSGGFIGVDIFFVISGFLISSIIFRSLTRGDFSFAEFYAHRIKRIFPALILVLAVTYTFGYFTLLPDELEQLGKHIAASAGFVQNFALWKETGYFDVATELKPLMHLWSLGIEEQFYLIYPLIIWLAWRMGLNLFILLAVMGVVSFALNVGYIESHPVSTYFLPHTRFWELLAGGLLASAKLFSPERFQTLLKNRGLSALFSSLSLPRERQSAFISNLLAFMGVLLIALPLFVLNKSSIFPGWWALPPVVGACCIIVAGPDAWFNRTILAHRFLVFIGLISYPLYLWHWPLLSYAHIMESATPSWEIRIAAVVLAFILAWLTYRLVERPIRFGRQSWIKTATLCVLLSFVAYVGYNAFKQDGLANRTQALINITKQFEWPGKNRQTPDCLQDHSYIKNGFCLSTGRGPVDAILIGDSHANHLFFGLSAAFRGGGANLLQAGKSGCLPFFDIDRHSKGKIGGCYEMNTILANAMTNDSIRTVILSGRDLLYITGNGFGPLPNEVNKDITLSLRTNPGLKDNPLIFETAMRTTLTRLVAGGKRVVFVIDVPELGFDPRSCVNVLPLRSRVKTPCAVPRDVVENRNREYRALVKKVFEDFPTVQVFDPVPHLCDAEYCWAMKDGKMLYRNDDHLSMAGSMYIGSKLAAEMHLP